MINGVIHGAEVQLLHRSAVEGDLLAVAVLVGAGATTSSGLAGLMTAAAAVPSENDTTTMLLRVDSLLPPNVADYWTYQVPGRGL